MPRRPPLPMLALFGLVVGVVACDARPTTSGPTAAPSACPKCECKCSCPDATSTGGTTAAVTPASTSEEAAHLRTITDPKVRAEVMRTSFDSTVPKCKGKL